MPLQGLVQIPLILLDFFQKSQLECFPFLHPGVGWLGWLGLLGWQGCVEDAEVRGKGGKSGFQLVLDPLDIGLQGANPTIPFPEMVF